MYVKGITSPKLLGMGVGRRYGKFFEKLGVFFYTALAIIIKLRKLALCRKSYKALVFGDFAYKALVFIITILQSASIRERALISSAL